MPQKRNPDAPELVRSKSGRVVGALNAVITMTKGLPMAYNRDLQEDRNALFDALFVEGFFFILQDQRNSNDEMTRFCLSLMRMVRDGMKSLKTRRKYHLITVQYP